MSQIQSQIDKDNQQLEVIKKQLVEAENTSRLVNNTINLIGDMEIKAAYARPVAELQMFWDSFHKGLQNQIATIKTLLPQEANTVGMQQGSNAPETPAAAPKPITELEVK